MPARFVSWTPCACIASWSMIWMSSRSKRLAPDVSYTSHWVLEDLNTRDAVAKLLRGKVAHVRRTKARELEALIGVATCGWQYGKPIVILSTPGSKSHEATVDFKIRDGLISAIAFVSPGMQKAALLKDPDSYVYDGVATAQPEPAPLAPPKPEPPDPDPADIIATFADVEDVLYAPLTDEAIGQCPKKVLGALEVRLVPFGYEPIQDVDHPEIARAMEAARRREIYLFAISLPETHGLIGVMTWPRPQVPWTSVKITSDEWYLRGGKKPYEFGIDFDVGCELRSFTAAPLIYGLAKVVARPRPLLAVAELEGRYLAIQSTALEPLKIDDTNVATWPRFLLRGFSAARHVARNRVLDRLSVDSPQRRITELALEAWPAKDWQDSPGS